jgi:hypothetical protein
MQELYKKAKLQVQIKEGKTIDLVERVFSDSFRYLVFYEPAGLSVKSFPYFRKKDLILRINTDFDVYESSNEYKYLKKLEEINSEYEKMFGKALKKRK